MKIFVEKTFIPGVLIVQNEAFDDARGFFMEVYRKDIFAGFSDLGLPDTFVQLSHSRSAFSVLRGLHFQWEPPMGKMMRVSEGRAFLVAVDIRKGSPTLGKWFGMELSADDRKQIYAPAGFARGFLVLSDSAQIEYLCTGTYDKNHELGIRWNDPEIGIEWPVCTPIITEKDLKACTLSEWLKRPEADNFKYSIKD